MGWFAVECVEVPIKRQSASAALLRNACPPPAAKAPAATSESQKRKRRGRSLPSKPSFNNFLQLKRRRRSNSDEEKDKIATKKKMKQKKPEKTKFKKQPEPSKKKKRGQTLGGSEIYSSKKLQEKEKEREKEKEKEKKSHRHEKHIFPISLSGGARAKQAARERHRSLPISKILESSEEEVTLPASRSGDPRTPTKASSSGSTVQKRGKGDSGDTWVIGIDGSKEAFYALKSCVRFASKRDKIHIVFIIRDPPGDKRATDTIRPDEGKWAEIIFLSDMLLVKAEEEAATLKRKMKKNSIQVDSVLVQLADCAESVGFKLCQQAERLKASWIVVGAGGVGSSISTKPGSRILMAGAGGGSGKGDGQASLGSVPRYLTENASCGVLVIRDPHAFLDC